MANGTVQSRAKERLRQTGDAAESQVPDKGRLAITRPERWVYTTSADGRVAYEVGGDGR